MIGQPLQVPVAPPLQLPWQVLSLVRRGVLGLRLAQRGTALQVEPLDASLQPAVPPNLVSWRCLLQLQITRGSEYSPPLLMFVKNVKLLLCLELRFQEFDLY